MQRGEVTFSVFFFTSSDKTKEAAELKEKKDERRKPLNDNSGIISNSKGSSGRSRNIEVKIKTMTITVVPNRTKKKGSVKNLTMTL